MEVVAYRTIPTSHPRFRGRRSRIYALNSDLRKEGLVHDAAVPDTVVLCNGCNSNLHPGTCDAVYIDGQLHDIYCNSCRERYFSEAAPLQE